MSTEHDICRAVESAISDGMSPKDFLQKAWELWESEMIEKTRRDNAQFRQALAKAKS